MTECLDIRSEVVENHIIGVRSRHSRSVSHLVMFAYDKRTDRRAVRPEHTARSGVLPGRTIEIVRLALLFILATSSFLGLRGAELNGLVRAPSGEPIAQARVTLVDSSVRETRSATDGTFRFASLTPGTYVLGASARDREYVERTVSISAANQATFQELLLGPETNRGRWTTAGRFDHLTFGGTNSGVLLPDGRIIYCHDTIDPVIFDPSSNTTITPPASPRIQGCHSVRLLQDGRVLYVGGADVQVYGPGTRQVKTFDPATERWTVLPELTAARWYPTLVQLANGELLAIGGGGLQNPVRTATSEICDPRTMTWSPAGNIVIGNEVSPVVLLPNGEVLMTHRPPQRFDPKTRTWRAAADFVQSNRTPDGDHADHEIVAMPDGGVVAIGYRPYGPAPPSASIVEIYDPARNEWRLGPTVAPLRSRPSILLLPDQRVLVLGGYKEVHDPTPTNAWGYMTVADLFDSERGSWRRLEPMSVAREYHAVPILIPDGRVVVIGGEGMPGIEPDTNVIEVFEPPYLFHGPRPEVRNLSSTTLRRGGTVSFDVANTSRPTNVILLGTAARTHFMDSGNARPIELPFVQNVTRVTVTIPSEAEAAPLGHYMLFVLVDDIPSVATIVRVEASRSRSRAVRH